MFQLFFSLLFSVGSVNFHELVPTD